MSLYEELSRKYPSQTVEPFKEPVLIIGVKDFKSEWEEQLKAEGCKVLVSDYLGKSCFLIRKPLNGEGKSINNAGKMEGEASSQTITEALQKPRQHRKPWSREDEERLIQLYNEGKSYEELAEIFGRSKKSLMQKIYDLGLNRQVEVKQLNLAKPKTDKPISQTEISNMGNCNEKDSEVRELLEASLSLLPNHKRAAAILLKEALNKLG